MNAAGKPTMDRGRPRAWVWSATLSRRDFPKTGARLDEAGQDHAAGRRLTGARIMSRGRDVG